MLPIAALKQSQLDTFFDKVTLQSGPYLDMMEQGTGYITNSK
jgi:hypothetical protein